MKSLFYLKSNSFSDQLILKPNYLNLDNSIISLYVSFVFFCEMYEEISDKKLIVKSTISDNISFQEGSGGFFNHYISDTVYYVT